MKTRLAVIMGLTMGVIFSQVEMNYSYEMQYGDGKQVTPLTKDTKGIISSKCICSLNYGTRIFS